MATENSPKVMVIEDAVDRIWNLCEGVEETYKNDELEEMEGDNGREWCGHNLETKTVSTGVRIATLNTQRKFYADELNWEIVYVMMIELQIDIIVITEPGKADEMRIAALKNWAITKGMAAEAVNRTHISNAGGIVMLVSQAWAGVTRRIHKFEPRKATKDRLLGVEFDNGKQGDHNKLLVIGYYGYNASQLKKAEVHEMHEWVWKLKKKFKRQNWKAPVIILGDMNATISTQYDTDRDGPWDGDEKEDDAATIEHLHMMGFSDPLREDFPKMRIVSRRKQGQGDNTGTLRYLDKILMTIELSEHEETRSAIYKPGIFGTEDTDHMMAVADIPIDVAAVAEVRATLWDVHKTSSLKWDSDEVGNMDETKIGEFNEKAKETRPVECTAEKVTAWLLTSGEGSVLRKVVKEYPRRVRKLKDFQATDWKMRQNTKIIREVIRKLEAFERPEQAMKRVPRLVNVPDSPHENITGNIVWRNETRIDFIEKLREWIEVTKEYSSREARKARAFQISENIKRRNARFNDPKKKCLKAVITSIMRRARVNEQIVSQKRSKGEGIATGTEEVAREVIEFYKEWMKSRVPWGERWKTWDAMMNLDENGLVNEEDKEFIEQAYRASYMKYSTLQREEGIWDGVWAPIEMTDLKKALKKFKGGKAGGPSGLTYDILKALDDKNLEPILVLMRSCLKERALPRALNESMIRALPKTEQGLSDLNLTRPIALMEALGKLFERILFQRIVEVLAKYQMIDLSQHGGMSHRGTSDPLRVLAEVMEDAEESGSEFHLFSADLSKAFDTLEYWSQAMSWRALGMPREMAEMLMRMDMEGESEVILGQGRTTSSVLGKEGWFRSGRGVRQGSIGGPIKWIVYMNFWLKYVNDKHGEVAYEMSKCPEVKLLSQMFIDDSNWAATSVKGMNQLIESGTRFTTFHGLAFNRKKSEYMVMNQILDEEGEWVRPSWPDGTELYETVRVTGNQEKRRTQLVEEMEHEARRILHQAIYANSPEDVWKRPMTEWEQTQERILEESEKWKVAYRTNLRDRKGEQISTDKLEAEIAKGKGKGTWRTQTEQSDLEIEEEVCTVIESWTRCITRRLRLETEEKDAMRYLGVWFEGGGKWLRQRQILNGKFKELNDRMSRSRPTRSQAIYCINATVNSALKFPLQIANVPNSVLEEWDRKNRRIVKEAGQLPMATPTDLMHLPRECGGLGLESLRQSVARIQIGKYITLLNTDSSSLAAEMTRAGRKRFKENGGGKYSIHRRIQRELEERGMEITESIEVDVETGERRLNFIYQGDQEVLDRETAMLNKKTGLSWDAYGDGATYASKNRAGWGLWMSDGNESREAWGRTQGRQTNDAAEAESILEAMLRINLEDNLEIYSDNSGCVNRWRSLKGGRPSIIEWSSRAIWLRIYNLMTHRERTGARTEIRWVHSHVDDESRRKSKSEIKCACREEGQEECNPYHRHHKGNEEADRRAKRGSEIEGGDDYNEAARGEMWFVLQGQGEIAQGNYDKWLREQQNKVSNNGNTGENEDTPTDERMGWERAKSAADMAQLTALLKTLDRKGKPSWRFWSRALCKSLPTYGRMMLFANSSDDNAYKTVYGGRLGEKGRCIRCDCELESVIHALFECPSTRDEWERTMSGVEYEWEQKGVKWQNYDWLTNRGLYRGWATEWALAGLVPREVIERVTSDLNMSEIEAYIMIRDTASRMLGTSERVWKKRIETTLEWEEENSELHEAKKDMKANAWSTGAVKVRAPRKESEVAEHKRKKREREQEVKEEAINRQRAKVHAMNNKRYNEGKVPMEVNKAKGMEVDAAKFAVGQWRATRKRAVKFECWAKGTRIIRGNMAKMSFQESIPKLTVREKQPNQRGIWFPRVGDEVEALWKDNEATGAQPRVRDRMYKGIVVGLAWEEGETPKFQIRYTDNTSAWHDNVDEAGTTIKIIKGGDLNNTQREIRNMIGHGSVVEVQWVETRKREMKWYRGTVVARDPERGIAIRYQGDTATVAWHSEEDLDNRRLVVITARRKGEFNNTSFQEQAVNMAKGCLLLTDAGKCECKACREILWPRERESADMETAVDVLRNMGPKEGRLELSKLVESKREKERQRETHALRQARSGAANGIRRRKGQNCKEPIRGALAAEDSETHEQSRRNEKSAERNGRDRVQTRAPGNGRDGQPRQGQEKKSRTGLREKRTREDQWRQSCEQVIEESSRGQDRRAGEESDGERGRDRSVERSDEGARYPGDKIQSSRKDDRNGTRSKDMGMASGSQQGEKDITDAPMDQQSRASDKRIESGRGMGRDERTGKETHRDCRQGGSTGVGEDVDEIERGTSKAGVSSAEGGKKRSNEIEQVELLQEDGRSRSDVCDHSTADARWGSSDGNRQGCRRSKRGKPDVDPKIGTVRCGNKLDTGRGYREICDRNRSPAGEDEAGGPAEGRPGCLEDPGCRRRLGVDRDRSRGNPRVRNDRSRQGGIPRPRNEIRENNEQIELRPKYSRKNKCAKKSSKAGITPTGIIFDGLAVAGVQDPDSSKCHECCQEMHEWETAARPKEPGDGGGDEGNERGGIQAVQTSNSEPDDSTGSREGQDTVCTRKPGRKRPVGDGMGKRNDKEEQQYMEAGESGSMRIWQEMHEADGDLDKYKRMDPERTNRDGEVHSPEVRRNIQECQRPRPGKARATNDCNRPQKKTKGRIDNGREEKRIQHKGWEEPGAGAAGEGNSRSGDQRSRHGNCEPEEEEENNRKTKRKPGGEWWSGLKKMKIGQMQGGEEVIRRGHDEKRPDAVGSIRKGVG